MNVFGKVSEVKQLLRKTFPELLENELIQLVRGAAKWHYKKRETITKEEASVYEVLINNSYNPDTVYKWFLLTRSPLELKEELKLKIISQREAFAKKRELNKLAATSHQQLLQEVIDSVNRYIVR